MIVYRNISMAVSYTNWFILAVNRITWTIVVNGVQCTLYDLYMTLYSYTVLLTRIGMIFNYIKKEKINLLLFSNLKLCLNKENIYNVILKGKRERENIMQKRDIISLKISYARFELGWLEETNYILVFCCCCSFFISLSCNKFLI